MSVQVVFLYFSLGLDLSFVCETGNKISESQIIVHIGNIDKAAEILYFQWVFKFQNHQFALYLVSLLSLKEICILLI